MTDNIMARALKSESVTKTHEATNHPHFFQSTIDSQMTQLAARNMTRQEMFNKGLLTVEDLDDEELRLGRCRDKNGRIPRVTKTLENIPRDLYEEMIAEHHKRIHEQYRQQLNGALATFAECMADPSAEWRDRNEAAKYITERVIGKPQERVQVTVTKAPWEELLSDVAHITRQQHLALKEGAIDVESFDVTDDVPSQNVPLGVEARTERVVDNLHSPRPGEQEDPQQGPFPGSPVRQEPNASKHDSVPVARDNVDAGHGEPPNANGRAQQRGNIGHGLGKPTWPGLTPVQPWDNIVKAPTHLQPAHSNPVIEVTLSQQIAEAEAEAKRVAAARLMRRKLIQDAKKRRIVQRTMGTDILTKLVNADAFGAAQDRLLAAVDNTQTQDEREADVSG